MYMLGFLGYMLLIAGLQIPKTLRKKDIRELVVYSILWLISTVYGALLIAGVAIVNPVEILMSIMGWIGNAIF